MLNFYISITELSQLAAHDYLSHQDVLLFWVETTKTEVSKDFKLRLGNDCIQV